MSVADELFSGDDERAEAVLNQIDARHLPELAAGLGSPNSDHAWWAARALAQLPGAEATRLLLGMLSHPDPHLRAVAAHAVGRRGDPSAIPRLLPMLGDHSEYLARLATDAIIHLGPPAVPALIQALEDDAAWRVRANAARALAAIADTSAIPALYKALDDESVLVQYWAEEGLDRMGAGQVYFKP